MKHNLKTILQVVKKINLNFEADFMKRETIEKLTNEVKGLEKELREPRENYGEEMETLYSKFKEVLNKRNRPRLNDAEGFNGFVIGYRLARKEILGVESL